MNVCCCYIELYLLTSCMRYQLQHFNAILCLFNPVVSELYEMFHIWKRKTLQPERPTYVFICSIVLNFLNFTLRTKETIDVLCITLHMYWECF